MIMFICLLHVLGLWPFAEIRALAEAQLGKVAKYLARSRGIKIPGQGYRTSQPVAMHSSGSTLLLLSCRKLLRDAEIDVHPQG